MIRFAGMVDNSVVDGKGIRITVFFQGCPRSCEGCHNPALQPVEGGEEISEEALVDLLLSKLTPLHSGITFSGGEPLMQADALFKVVEMVRKKKPDLDIWVYTGYTFEQIKDLPVMKVIDVLVDGPFVLAKRDISLPFRGSSNQRIIDVPGSLRSDVVVELDIR